MLLQNIPNANSKIKFFFMMFNFIDSHFLCGCLAFPHRKICKKNQ
jgi:hypothetical protein